MNKGGLVMPARLETTIQMETDQAESLAMTSSETSKFE